MSKLETVLHDDVDFPSTYEVEVLIVVCLLNTIVHNPLYSDRYDRIYVKVCLHKYVI
jgi:hypothetical protein